ncbi:MAG: DUF1254 domain-containing protein [Kangiellaceae bacterium]|nr:DUF1254 domain-containing protein [Kangiellaceae bacterium]
MSKLTSASTKLMFFLIVVITCSTTLQANTKVTKLSQTLVTRSNFAVAETDLYMSRHVKNYPVNSIRHSRELSSKNNQFVIRESQDILYSHAVVDISKGAKISNSAWDIFSIIQVIDENQYTIAVIYPGETKMITPDMVTLGEHVFLNMRTGLRSLDKKGLAEAHEHQDGFKIESASSRPYVSKGFDKKTLDVTRAELITHITDKAFNPSLAFGLKNEVDANSFLIASAAGWGGLPPSHAAYIASIQPRDKAKQGRCASITLPAAPLQYHRGGFFSVTTYSASGWIATDHFALNNRQAMANRDGRYTFHFNCPDKKNNLIVEQNWTMVIRLYMPNSVEEILGYIKRVQKQSDIVEK